MKICQLRIKNLNSLAGSWHIDFEALAAQHGGLFAITGPTGSGKSTLLDGICLALFGRTPRLKDVNSSSNEMMTRHCGDCMAEVTFETAAGRYRVLWSQRRAKGAASGKLQPQKQELSQLDESGSGTIIENKVSQVPLRIKELCGMDFQQFTRSVFLPQGGFAAFLKATSAERAELLEGLTGTELYGQISRKVHELTRQQGEELRTITSRKEELHLLNDDERRELTEKLSLWAVEAKRCEEAQAQCQHELSIWRHHHQLEALRRQYQEKKKEVTLLEAQSQIWFPRLEADRRGRSFVTGWADLCHVETHFAGQEDRRRSQTIELQLVQQNLLEAKTELQDLTERQKKQQQKMEQQLPLLAQVVQLDEELLQMEETLKQQKNELEQQKLKVRQQQSAWKEALQRFEEKAEEARQCQSRIQQRNESPLYSFRHFWGQRIEAWQSLYSYRQSKELDLTTLSDGKKELEEAAVRHLRGSLQPGFPCPVCGALEHEVSVESKISRSDDVFATLAEEMAHHMKWQRYLAAREQLSELIDAMGCEDEPTPQELRLFWQDLQSQWKIQDEEASSFEQNDAEEPTPDELTQRMGQEQMKYELALQRYDDGMQRFEALRQRRNILFSGDAVAERRALELEREALEGQALSCSAALEEQNRQERQISSELSRLEGVLAEGKASLIRQRRAFESSLKEQGFPSCEEWQSLLLSEHERLVLEGKDEELNRYREALDELRRDVNRREAELPATPDIGQEALTLAVAMHQSHSQKAYESMGQCRETLRLDDQNRQRSATLRDEEKAQRDRLNRWEQLHNLIGSADGKKFRSFVQGLSFRSLVTQASLHLQDLCGRYELLPSRSDPLDMEVRDLWQAGEIRSVQNLSGGETFMVSLALALALSGAGGLQETLFLDEGFGALDDESLDMVLDALEKLRQRGRVIGVISHVAALRQRISCQIQLIQNQGGRSSLAGPGCEQHL